MSIIRKKLIQRKPTASGEQNRQTDADYEQVVFKTFTSLIAKPVQKKTVLDTGGTNGSEHDQKVLEGKFDNVFDALSIPIGYFQAARNDKD